jgi:hypothetical protein
MGYQPYGFSNATFWWSSVLDSGSADPFANQVCSYVWSDAGSTLAQDGSAVQQIEDLSGSSNFATQTTSANRPTFKAFGGWQTGDGSQACLLFKNNGSNSVFLNLPSSAAIGNGTPANEGTIFCGLRWGLQTGFPFGVGGFGVYQNGTKITLYNNGVGPNFPTSHLLPTMHPHVVALRFASSAGAVGANETRLFCGTNYQDVLTTNYLGGAATGGFIGSINGSQYFLDMDLYELAVFNMALSTSNTLRIIQAMQDRIASGWTNSAQVMFFGDSRTFGYNSNVGAIQYSRGWTLRCLKNIGGYARAFKIAVIGNTIAQQQSAANTYLPTLDAATYGKTVCIGEAGINDILANTPAATIQTSLLTLWNSMLAGGATNVVALTIAPATSLSSSQETVRQTVNAWMTTPGNLPAGVTVCNNAADPRLSLAGYRRTSTCSPTTICPSSASALPRSRDRLRSSNAVSPTSAWPR